MGQASPILDGDRAVPKDAQNDFKANAVQCCLDAIENMDQRRQGCKSYKIHEGLPDNWELMAQEPPKENEAVEENEEADAPLIFEASAAELRRQAPAFRTKYLGRLAYTRAWEPRQLRPPQHQTVTIFDWDDTLLCTSFLGACPDTDVGPQLKTVAALARQLLSIALHCGRVLIITNAVEGWVQYSAKKYVPELCPILDEVRIVSARSRFEQRFPDRVDRWKVEAFLEVQQQMYDGAVANLISIGDSQFEMDAVRAMGRQSSEAVVKMVKLWEKPSVDDLRRQLELVLREFRRIAEHPTDAKIGFERKRKQCSSEAVAECRQDVSHKVAGA